MSSDMRYVLPGKSKKRERDASSKSSSQPFIQDSPAPSVTEVPVRGMFVVDPTPNRPKIDEPRDPLVVKGSLSQPSQHLEKGKGAVVAANLVVPPAPEEPLIMPGSRIGDFIVTDVVDRHIYSALRLPPRFSLPIQAILLTSTRIPGTFLPGRTSWSA